jgi:hypothetical protein
VKGYFYEVLRGKVSIFCCAVLTSLCTFLLLAGNILGQETASEQIPPVPEEVMPIKAEPGGSGSWHHQYLPPDPLYAPYAADPRRVDFGLQVLHYTRVRIPDSGNTRFDLKTGGQFGLVRFHPYGVSDLGWQLSLEGGFNAQFDIDKHLDNIGWDGRYGLLLTSAQSKNLSLKFGYLHDSSHVGDEYAQRTGRLRIGYTREEVAAGASWLTDNGWRTYAEYAYATHRGNEQLQKPGRAQLGMEWQPKRTLHSLYRGWYGALDVSAMQERDWKMDVSLQTGYRIDTIGKTWRYGIDLYSGRPPIGEFFQHTETYLGWGIWVDVW